MKGKEKIYLCPRCGTNMVYVGGMLDWKCPNCGAEGTVEYDSVNNENYIDVAKEYSYKEIYRDPINNKPDCCKACGGPFPDCMSSCKIFDD